MEEKTSQPQPIAEFFQTISDPQKLQIISQMINAMAPEFKQVVINELARQQAQAGGEVTINITSDAQHVRVNFGKALAWFIMPKAHALQIGQLLMQHAGATLERIQPPGGDQSPPINIKPM